MVFEFVVLVIMKIFNNFVLVFCQLCIIYTITAHPPLQVEDEQKFYIKNFPKPSALESFEAISPLYKLNDTWIPTNYELELVVILDEDPSIGKQFTAPGKVTIDAKPTEDTTQITLHSSLLIIDVDSVKVTNAEEPSEVIRVTGVSNDTDDGLHFLTISTDTKLVSDTLYKIYIEFVAPISTDRLDGLYLATYTDPETQQVRRLAATQMESTHARQLFPSFDEPALKAPFDVTIIRKNNYTALANGNLIDTKADPTRPGWSIDKFNKTVPMSPYLFALVVSDYTYSEADLPIFGGKPVRVYAQPHIISSGGGDYAARVSAEILKFYDEYFQAEYPLAKMDVAPIPQFAAGAMENYGLNLYSEGLLVYYANKNSESSRSQITSVLAHELGHQNFGDLVTCNWCTQIWLNEGFATYVANLAVDALYPEFKPREDNGQFINSMNVDVTPASHPLQNNVQPPNVDGHTGTITYDKGASINRMTEKFLTEETFQKGLRYYLQDMKFKAVHSDDLFRNLDIAAAEDKRLPSGLTVKQILDTWTLQKGHPLVRVSVARGDSVYITQEKYAHMDDNPSSLWYLPVTVVTQDKPTLENNVPELWLNNTSTITNYPHDASKWIMINQDATGYYRVLYDEVLTSRIRDQLEANASVISPLSRSQLLEDYFTMAFREYVGIETAMNLTTYLAQEDHFSVWNVVFNQLRKTYNLLSSTDSYLLFRDYMLPRIEPALVKIGVEQNPMHIGMDAIYRAKLLDWACSMEHPACMDYATKLFEEWQTDVNNSPVTLDTQSTMHCAIVASGGEEAYLFTLIRYVITTDSLKSVLLNSLGCASDTNILQDLLERTVNVTSNIIGSDATTAIQRVAMNVRGRPLVLDFLEMRLSEIIDVIGKGSPNPVNNIIGTLATYMGEQSDLNRLVNFISENEEVLQPINSNLQGHLNTIRSNIQWMNEYGNHIVTWMKNN